MTIEAALERIPLFSSLPASTLAELARAGKMLSFEMGHVIFRAGDAAEVMYVILEGKVCVYKEDENNNRVELSLLEAGEFFGELALIDREPRSASVLCATPCRFFALDRPVFLSLLSRTDTQTVSFSILASVVDHVRVLTEKYVREELQQRVLSAEIEAEQHRSLAHLVAGVAHELNTPLGVANTAIDMVHRWTTHDALHDALPDDGPAAEILEQMQEAAHLALRNIGRAHELVENFKKVSVSQLDEQQEPVDLRQVVRESLELFELNARHAKLEIAITNDIPAEHVVWLGYRGQLSQVLTNLLFNIDRHAYPERKGGDVEIAMRTRVLQGIPHFVLAIRDFGRGIIAENLPKIFTPFFTTGRSRGGTGLGLSIVRNIVVDALKGTIDVESTVGEGTTFTITFPQDLSQPAPLPGCEPR
ncbi:MAG: ATP-binding protein [Myxococcota bacterium]